MLTSKDVVVMAQGAAAACADYLLDALGIGQKGKAPTADECRAFVHGLALAIAQLELYLKLHLPPEEQDQVRSLIEKLATGVAQHVSKIQKTALDSAQGPGKIESV